MRFQLAKQTGRAVFATRETAAEARAKLSGELSRLRPCDSLILDLAGVEAMTISYADELVAKLTAERWIHGITDTFFLIAGATPEVAETIAVALERRNLFVVHQRQDGLFELLSGPFHLKETYERALELGEFTARELADALGISLPAANNRIKMLAQVGAVTRQRHDPAHGGRQFIYQAQQAA